jgi:hypothetical protein
MFRRFCKRLLTPPLVVLAAVFIFFEEWLWKHVVTFMAWVAKLPVISRLESQLSKLPPYPALILLLLPGLLLLPVKLAAFYFMAHGHALAGITVILTAKVVGTALVARMFTICQPALMTVHWLRRLTDWLIHIRNSLYIRIKRMPAWKSAVQLAHGVRQFFRSFRRDGLRRRWLAIRRKMGRKPPDTQVPSQFP